MAGGRFLFQNLASSGRRLLVGAHHHASAAACAREVVATPPLTRRRVISEGGVGTLSRFFHGAAAAHPTPAIHGYKEKKAAEIISSSIFGGDDNGINDESFLLVMTLAPQEAGFGAPLSNVVHGARTQPAMAIIRSNSAGFHQGYQAARCFSTMPWARVAPSPTSGGLLCSAAITLKPAFLNSSVGLKRTFSSNANKFGFDDV
ncbi:hypothetical protein U9M48_037805 [Paspalum notatum var. saurae]|uniref:Uncharacterized protein n=1 Tax=Paspalum notatum var. saurae TaxID=547442 RepID=A0AAQ3XBH9_PASNO